MTIPTAPRSFLTPHPLKTVLWILFFSSIACYICQFFQIPLANSFSLSPELLSKGYLWTLLTYPFVYLDSSLFDLVFRLIFNSLFFWIFGIPLLERLGTKKFLLLFFGATLSGGVSGTAALYLLHSPQLFAGPSPPLLALITSWTLFHGMRNLHLSHFLMRPIWIFLILVGINLALDAISNQWVQFAADAAAAFYAYLFCLISEKVRSSVSVFYPFERAVLRSLETFHERKQSTQPKIYDFKTGQPILNDDQFMDTMLAKISSHGERILSPEEKTRMQQISEKKAKKKKQT